MKDRLLGLSLCLFAIALHPKPLGLVLSLDGELGSSRVMKIFLLASIVTFALGLAFIIGRLKLKSQLHSILTLSLLFPALMGLITWLHIGEQVNARRDRLRNIEITNLISLRLNQLSDVTRKGKLALSDSSLFSSQVKIEGLTTPPPLWNPVGFEIDEIDWPIASHKREPFAPLRSFVGNPINFRFRWPGRGFKSVSEDEVESSHPFEGSAEGGVSWKGKVQITWSKDQSGALKIRRFKIDRFVIQKSTTPLFTSRLVDSDSATNRYYEQIRDSLNAKVRPLSMYLAVKRRPSLSIVDYDNDGDDDLFSTARSGKCRLYQNDGKANFQEVAESVGLSLEGPVYCSLFVDIDNDGDQDALLASNRGVHLFVQRDLVFHEAQNFSNIGEVGSLAALDIENDGLIDIVAASFAGHDRGIYILKNRGTSLHLKQLFTGGSSLATAAADLDADGDLDVLVSSQSEFPKVSWNRNGELSEPESSALKFPNARGISFGDVDQDGDLDLLLTGAAETTKIFRYGDGGFEEGEALSGSADNWSTGAQFIDLNNDGWLDIYEPTGLFTPPIFDVRRTVGHVFQGYQPNLAHLNLGSDWLEAAYPLGLGTKADSRGVVHSDFNNDGALDIAVIASSHPYLQLFLGLQPPNRYLTVRLEGGSNNPQSSDWSNRDGIGAELRLELGERTLLRDRRVGSGYGCQNSAIFLFPLGPGQKTSRLNVRWPSGRVQSVEVPPHILQLTMEERKARLP